jgi:hypothetical protein
MALTAPSLSHVMACKTLGMREMIAIQSSLKFVKPTHIIAVVADDGGIVGSQIAGNVSIIHERTLDPMLSLEGVRLALPHRLRHRASWYYQQFLKIHVALSSPCEKVLIADSDLAFQKYQEAFQKNRNVVSVVPHGYRRWNLFSEHIGIDPMSNDVFVSEHILVSKDVLAAYAFWIQSRFKAKYFWEAICRALHSFVARDPIGAKYKGATFQEVVWADIYSEYQTLGNFLVRHFSSSTLVRQFGYCRFYPSGGYCSQTVGADAVEAIVMENG